jgi:hypothetical protein
MPQRRTIVIVALCLILGISIAFWSRTETGTRAAQDPLSAQEPLIQRPNLPPTPTRAAAPNAPASAAPVGRLLLQQQFASADAAAVQQTWTALDVNPLQYDEEPARWGLYNGLLSQLWTGNLQAPRPDPTIVVTGQPTWRDYSLRAAAYPEGNMELGLVARQQGTSFYRLRLLNDATETPAKVLLEKVVDGQATVLASQAGPGYSLYRWYNLRLSVVGTQLTAQVDNGPALSASDASLTQGQAGVYGLAIGQLGFDNVSVTTP